jgi:hypothetical protein
VRRGCISLGNVVCDDCHDTILYPERYLSVDKPQNLTLCINCSRKRGLILNGTEKKDSDVLFELGQD